VLGWKISRPTPHSILSSVLHQWEEFCRGDHEAQVFGRVVNCIKKKEAFFLGMTASSYRLYAECHLGSAT
jgi:hypothetical protein